MRRRARSSSRGQTDRSFFRSASTDGDAMPQHHSGDPGRVRSFIDLRLLTPPPSMRECGCRESWPPKPDPTLLDASLATLTETLRPLRASVNWPGSRAPHGPPAPEPPRGSVAAALLPHPRAAPAAGGPRPGRSADRALRPALPGDPGELLVRRPQDPDQVATS